MINFLKGILGFLAFLNRLLEPRNEGLNSTRLQQDQVKDVSSPVDPTTEIALEKERRELRLETFKRYQDHLWNLRQSNTEKQDNLVLTLSAGILGLSVTFVKDVVPLARVIDLPYLMISWGLFIGAILSTLVSYWAGRHDMDLQLDYAEKYYLECNAEYFNKPNPWQKWTVVINVLSSAFFASAVILLVIFVSTNLERERIHLRQEQSEKASPLVAMPTRGTLSHKNQTVKAALLKEPPGPAPKALP